MATQEMAMEYLNEVFTDLESRLNGKAGGALHAFNKSSFDTLREVNFPNRKHEDWKNTAVQRLITPKYKLAGPVKKHSVAEIEGLDTYVITILNGVVVFDDIDPSLASSGIGIHPLHSAMDLPAWKTVLNEWLKPVTLSSNHAFEFLNFAFQAGGLLLDVPKNTVLDKPIEIRILHDDTEVAFSHPLYLIQAGESSSITVIERFERNTSADTIAEGGLINALGYIHVEKNASVRHIKWQDLPDAQSLVYKLSVSQQRDSRFESLAVDFGGDIIRNNIDVELNESNTYTSLQAGYLARRRQSMDHQTRINHKVPHCESHELYKGIVDEQASAAFNGKVYVHPDAQKTNAYQQNDTLVLSSNALMNSKPQLEIYADDVKCSHGATIGQLDEKSLFYLKARGINEQTAKHILKAAFLAAVLDSTPVDALRLHIRSRMSLDL
jgi:Fe-S cluster assembly protein SufD